jgi:hypothetical protein
MAALGESEDLGSVIAGLLGRAEGSQDAAVVLLAERIARDLDALDGLLLDDEIRDLEERLVAARARREGLESDEPEPAGEPESTSAVVRRWAAANGIVVAPTGRISHEVIAAYNEAL